MEEILSRKNPQSLLMIQLVFEAFRTRQPLYSTSHSTHTLVFMRLYTRWRGCPACHSRCWLGSRAPPSGTSWFPGACPWFDSSSAHPRAQSFGRQNPSLYSLTSLCLQLASLPKGPKVLSPLPSLSHLGPFFCPRSLSGSKVQGRRAAFVGAAGEQL